LYKGKQLARYNLFITQKIFAFTIQESKVTKTPKKNTIEETTFKKEIKPCEL
jgi:hypothetical protein